MGGETTMPPISLANTAEFVGQQLAVSTGETLSQAKPALGAATLFMAVVS